MDDTPSGGCYKLPESKHGDVDRNGDLVDLLTERVRAAVGECVGFTAEEHVAVVTADVQRIKLAARGLS